MLPPEILTLGPNDLIVISHHPSSTYPSLIHIHNDSALWIHGYSTCSSPLPLPRSLPFALSRGYCSPSEFLDPSLLPPSPILPSTSHAPSGYRSPIFLIYMLLYHSLGPWLQDLNFLSFGYNGKSAMIQYRAFFSTGRALMFFLFGVFWIATRSDSKQGSHQVHWWC